ncbi:hypothetical protein ACFP3J_29550, partial [Streptomyces nogalater]
MSMEREYGAEAHVPHGAGGAPGVRPSVYHPLPAPAPAYEEYADPAAAHGWRNDYDATRELPPAAGEPDRPAEAAPSAPSAPSTTPVRSVMSAPSAAGAGRARR